MSHFAVYDDITLGPTRVKGILREMTFVMANAVVSTAQSDPWRVISSDPIDGSSMVQNSRGHPIVTSDSQIKAPPIGYKPIYGWIARFMAACGIALVSVAFLNQDLSEVVAPAHGPPPPRHPRP